jgi:hypothetical protein
MDASEAKWLKQLQDENGKLKKLLADAMLDTAALKDLPLQNGDARCEGRGGRASQDETRDGQASQIKVYRNFIAKAVPEWIPAVGAKTAYVLPRSLWENG